MDASTLEPRPSSWRSFAWSLVLVAFVAVMAGSASALFLGSLDRVTQLRFNFPVLLYALPLAGIPILFLYQSLGPACNRGANLILDEIHSPQSGVPGQLAPLILVTTLLTHLFGGSAGREGTAVQMGGGLAGAFIRLCRIPQAYHRSLLLAGIAAGFGSVFGTPIAGAIFAMEVLAIGRFEYAYAIPCLVAAFLGDLTCTAWGIHHTPYKLSAPDVSGALGLAPMTVKILFSSALAGIAFGLAAVLFGKLTHGIQHQLHSRIAIPWLRPFFAGLTLIVLTWLLGTRSYLGLGVSSPSPADITLLSCFQPNGATHASWVWKLVFTAITLGSGFKGGEVTPLFFIGAALGHSLSHLLGVPTDVFAALGFVSVFAGASNTPLACTALGLELFGPAYAPCFALACFTAYLASGHTGIYSAQRVARSKPFHRPVTPGATLAKLHAPKSH